ncbi:MAG TPA: hypothetical protein VF407_09340, partial [Polyangiaceae bacterium]
MNCQRCGSVLDPTARTCPFCGLTTPHGAVASQMDEAAAQMNAQRRAFVDDQQRRIAIARNESSATTAMWVSLISVVLCCSPMGIVGAALGFKARSEANKLGAPPSSKTMIAIAIGLVGAIATACLLTFAWVSSTQEEEAADKRAAEIDKKIAPKLTAPTIDHDTACQLAESYLIHNGWD